jgi:hypothetical protein
MRAGHEKRRTRQPQGIDMSGPQSENEKSFIIIMTSAATARIRQEHETVGNGFQSGTLSRESGSAGQEMAGAWLGLHVQGRR